MLQFIFFPNTGGAAIESIRQVAGRLA